MAQSIFDDQPPQTFEEVAQNPPITPGATIPAPGGFQGTRGAITIPPQVTVQPATEGAGFGTAFQSSFVTDPQAQLRILAADRFPDMTLPDAMARYGFVDGKPVFVNEAGELEAATGGAADTMGAILAESPEIAGAVVGAFTPMPVVGSAIGAATGEATKRLLANIFLDDPQTIGGNVLGITAEGALDLTFGVGAKGATGLINRNAIARSEKAIDIPSLQRARQNIFKATGIELDLAQVADLPELAQLKKWAAKHPSVAAEVIQASDDLIAGQSRAAIERLINIMAGGNPSLKSGVQAMNAANAALSAAKLERAQAVGPLYKKAFKESVQDMRNTAFNRGLRDANQGLSVNSHLFHADEFGEDVSRAYLEGFRSGRTGPIDQLLRPETGAVSVDVSRTLGTLDQFAESAKGPIAALLKRTRKLFNAAGTDEIDTTVQGLHNTRRAIDQMIDTKSAGTQRLNNEMVFQLRQIRESLTDDLVNGSDLYRQANDAWKRKTQSLIDPLMNSPIGVLAAMKEQNAGQAAAKIFSGSQLDPATIRLARNAMLKAEAANPELAGAWNGAVAQWLQQNFLKASRELQTGQAVNIAGKFRQLVIGTDLQKAAMREAIGPESVAGFNQVMDALKKVASTPLGGSDTAFNQLVTQKIGRSRFSFLQAILSPRRTALEGIEQRFMDDMANGIADALTDPRKATELKRIFAMRPSAEKSILIASVVLGPQAASAATETVLGPPTQMPQMRGLNRPPGQSRRSVFDEQ